MENSWEKFAQNFEDLNNYVIGLEDMELIKSKIATYKNLENVLELACGNGTYSKILLTNASHLTATDLSEEMVKVTKNRLKDAKNVKVEVADSMQLPYENGSFDSVFMANLLHIVPDYEKIVEETYRVLKPNGKIYVLDFTSEGMTFLNKMKMIYRYLKTYGKPSSSAKKPKFSPNDMKELLESKNFNIHELELLGNKSKAVFAIGEKAS